MPAAAPLLALVPALLAASAHASIWITAPVASATCAAGQPCDVAWTDNGQQPLLNAIGACNVVLATGDYHVVQTLPSVDASALSLTFTPDATVGPDGPYYIVFSAVNSNYQAFSASFTLTGMTGTTPTGGSSTAGPTTATAGPSTTSTPSGSSTSPSISASVSPSGASPSGASTPLLSPTTPTGLASAPGTTSPGVTTPTLTTPTLSPNSTPTTSRASTSASTTPSASPTSAAGHVVSSLSLGGVVALVALAGALAF